MNPNLGNNKFGRAIAAQGERLGRQRAAQVAGALVDVTTYGTFIRPKRDPRARAGAGGGVPRWG